MLNVSTKAFKLLVLIEKTNDKLIAGVDREEAFKEFNQKVTPVVNAMVDIAQQASWKDFVRETTAFCVGCKIDSKIFHLVGEAATFAARTESLTKNVFEALAELTAPEAVAVTAEGITVNAGKAAEQCVLSEIKEVAKRGTKVSEALAEQVESNVKECQQIFKMPIEYERYICYLNSKYGQNNVDQALKILNLNNENICSRGYAYFQLEKVTQELIKINSCAEWKSFMFDPAKSKISINNVYEATTGIACIEQNLLKQPILRSFHPGEEFIDGIKQAWDVKTAVPFTSEGRYIFNADKFVSSVVKELVGKENVIINISLLNSRELSLLYSSLKNNLSVSQLQRIVVVHTTDSSLSKSSEALINFLDQYGC